MRAWIPLILAAACGTPSSSAGKQDPLPDPSKPDEVAVAIPTRIEARFVTVMLGTQWRDRVVAEAIHVDRSNPDEWILRGGATVRCSRGKRVGSAGGGGGVSHHAELAQVEPMVGGVDEVGAAELPTGLN